MPGDSPDTLNRISAVVDDVRRELAREYEMTSARPGGLILENVQVRSHAFEEALPELLAASHRNRLIALRTEVSRLVGTTEQLTASTTAGTRSANDLLKVSRRLLTAALGTLGVAIVTLVIALLQLAR